MEKFQFVSLSDILRNFHFYNFDFHVFRVLLIIRILRFEFPPSTIVSQKASDYFAKYHRTHLTTPLQNIKTLPINLNAISYQLKREQLKLRKQTENIKFSSLDF
jgi:hypothetical protein